MPAADEGTGSRLPGRKWSDAQRGEVPITAVPGDDGTADSLQKTIPLLSCARASRAVPEVNWQQETKDSVATVTQRQQNVRGKTEVETAFMLLVSVRPASHC